MERGARSRDGVGMGPRLATLAVALAVFAGGCSLTTTWSTTRSTASDSLACPEERLETVFAHSYNLGVGDHVLRGCGRDIIVTCASGPTRPNCRPTYVTPRG
jgi:hypothetical protein